MNNPRINPRNMPADEHVTMIYGEEPPPPQIEDIGPFLRSAPWLFWAGVALMFVSLVLEPWK